MSSIWKSKENRLFLGLAYVCLLLAVVYVFCSPGLFDFAAKYNAPEFNGTYEMNVPMRITGDFLTYAGEGSYSKISVNNQSIFVSLTAFQEQIFYKICQHAPGDIVAYSGFFQVDKVNKTLVFYNKRELC